MILLDKPVPRGKETRELLVNNQTAMVFRPCVPQLGVSYLSSEDDKSTRLREMIDQIIEGKVNANRRYVDQVLEFIMDYHHSYYLERLAIEVMRAEAEEKAGNTQAAFRHRVMVDTYKGLLEKAFNQTAKSC